MNKKKFFLQRPLLIQFLLFASLNRLSLSFSALPSISTLPGQLGGNSFRHFRSTWLCRTQREKGVNRSRLESSNATKFESPLTFDCISILHLVVSFWKTNENNKQTSNQFELESQSKMDVLQTIFWFLLFFSWSCNWTMFRFKCVHHSNRIHLLDPSSVAFVRSSLTNQPL